MALETGDDGKVLIGGNPLADVTLWTFRTVAVSRDYASSATSGYRRRVVGARQGGGVIRFQLDLNSPVTGQLEEGSSVTLLLYLDASRNYSVPAVIDVLQLETDINSGKPIGGVAEFSTNGAWTRPSY